jgi:hypothetical protein
VEADWSAARAQLLKRLEAIDAHRERLSRTALGSPRPASRAEIDANSPFQASVAIYAGQNVAMGLDHIRAWRVLVRADEITDFAHMTLLRSALEGGATAQWLLGSDDSAERVIRAAILGLEDHRQRRTLEAEVANVAEREAAERGEIYEPHNWEGGARSGEDRYADHLATMTAAGMDEERPPSFTDLMRDFGPGAHFYQLASAFAHRREWSMAFAEERGRVEDTGPGAGAIQLGPSSFWAVRMTDVAMDELEHALDELEAYFGYPAA